MVAGRSEGDEAMFTTCWSNCVERARCVVNRAITRPLSYSPQMTTTAAERLLASSASGSEDICSGHSTARTPDSPAA